MNFEKIITETRINYEKTPKQDFGLSIPGWVRHTKMRNIYFEEKVLALKGKIVYGHLVQANKNISRRTIFGGSLPGDMLFSMEPYYDKHPEELAKLAREIYKYKNQSNAPSEIKKFVALITNEYTYEQNIALPMSLTPNGKVYFTTFMIWRTHLIDKYLKTSLFPVLANPHYSNSSMIVPKEYWTEDYKEFYNNFAYCSLED